MNILILSCGTRNLLVRYFKDKKNGFNRVIGTDCSQYAPALYETDSHYIVPTMNTPGYLDIILGICKKECINVVLPLQEDELFLIASNKKQFVNQGVIPVVSEPSAIELCRDKYAMFQHLKKHGLPVMETCRSFQEFQSAAAAGYMRFPVFLKPNRGCGSTGIQKIEAPDLLELVCKYNEDSIIQNFADGEEYGADIFVDSITGKVVSVFVKQKLRMRAGETEKSLSFKDEELFHLIKKAVSTLSLSGPIDMDIFRVNGQYYISEINPRFGGGYPHAYECGISFPQMICNNALGNENTDTTGHYEAGICMLKYTDLMTIKPE